jgi:hypothetical protein
VDTKIFCESSENRLADGRIGLEEVKDTNDLVRRLDIVGEKEWFRRQMGMQKGEYICLLKYYAIPFALIFLTGE